MRNLCRETYRRTSPVRESFSISSFHSSLLGLCKSTSKSLYYSLLNTSVSSFRRVHSPCCGLRKDLGIYKLQITIYVLPNILSLCCPSVWISGVILWRSSQEMLSEDEKDQSFPQSFSLEQTRGRCEKGWYASPGDQIRSIFTQLSQGAGSSTSGLKGTSFDFRNILYIWCENTSIFWRR